MAKLSELVNVNINRDIIQIQGVDIPVIFTFESFPYLEESYGKSYHIFEKDLNRMIQKGSFTPGKNELKLMQALIYGMVRGGGTDCTPHELKNSIPISDVPNIFQKVLDIFTNQRFQQSDIDKLNTEKK